MKKKILIIIIPVLIIILLGTGYLLTNNKSTSEISISNSKASTDESGIDWSKYETYDITLDSGNVNISKAGVYNIKGALKQGTIIVNTNDNVKLILNGVDITSKNNPGIYVKKAKNTYIELKGKNKITTTTSNTLDAAIYSKDDLFIYGSGSIEINSNKDGISSKDDLTILSGTYKITSTNDGIKGKDSVTINKGKFTINSGDDGIKTTNEEKKGELLIKNGTFTINSENDGISSSNNLTINDGTFTITSGKTKSDESTKSLKSSNLITINGGTYYLTTMDDALHSNKNIVINDGKFTVSAQDDGMHADSNITIKKSTINIKKSNEGIEAYNITIDDGEVNVTSSDDGINVCNPKGTTSAGMDEDTGGKLTINGGTLYVNASGDGLDSNGSIYMNGGTVHIDGPTNNGNGALDYNGQFVIKGGELIAVGASGMAQNVSESSTQKTLMVNLSTQASGKITIGNIEYNPAKTYSSVVISSPSLTQSSYTLTTGSSSQDVTLTNTVTTIGGNNGMMNGGPMRGGRNAR